MDNQSGPEVRQHVRLAINGGDPQESGSFGCESAFKSVGGEATPRGTLRDSQRSVTKPRGFHPEPDHGGY